MASAPLLYTAGGVPGAGIPGGDAGEDIHRPERDRKYPGSGDVLSLRRVRGDGLSEQRRQEGGPVSSGYWYETVTPSGGAREHCRECENRSAGGNRNSACVCGGVCVRDAGGVEREKTLIENPELINNVLRSMLQHGKYTEDI